MALSNQQLTEIQAKGIRWTDKEAMGLSRNGGAGPTDHKALDFNGKTSMIPVFNLQVDDSPWRAELSNDRSEARIFHYDALIDTAKVPQPPKFYALQTAGGIPYSKIATLHSKDVLATTVLQECVRYRARETSCQFCAIEESLKSGKTIAYKTPAMLAEVARAAVELDGIKQMILTTGTPKTLDRGAEVLEQSVRAIRAVVDIPIQVQCEPPQDDFWFSRLKDAGVDALGMHLEAVSDRVRKKIMPGKASVPLSRYMSAYQAAVKVFGRGNVSTYILAGLGDSEQEIESMSRQLIAMGVYPFIVPFVPVAGTPLEQHPMPDSAMLDRLFQKIGPLLVQHGMTSDTLAAGCAKCGACSSLKSYEKQGAKNAPAGEPCHA